MVLCVCVVQCPVVFCYETRLDVLLTLGVPSMTTRSGSGHSLSVLGESCSPTIIIVTVYKTNSQKNYCFFSCEAILVTL